MECKITNDHIDTIWQAAQLKHCSKQVHDLLPPLIKNLEAGPVLHLYHLLCKLEPKDHTEQVGYSFDVFFFIFKLMFKIKLLLNCCCMLQKWIYLKYEFSITVGVGFLNSGLNYSCVYCDQSPDLVTYLCMCAVCASSSSISSCTFLSILLELLINAYHIPYSPRSIRPLLYNFFLVHPPNVLGIL